MKTIDSDFLSKGTRCAGTFYLPDAEKPPVVVMAHGFAAERSFRLPAFAERFAAKGIAAYLFDYRNFGDSDGEPRNLVSPRRHIQDWRAAISHVREIKEVDSGRLALYGSSYGGGHVLAIAAKDPGVSAVISQVPFVNGVAYLLQHSSPRYVSQGVYHGSRDIINMMLFRPPHLVPVVGEPDEFACMNTPEAKPGYMSMIPEGSKWRNEAPARVALMTILYWPNVYASRINCPVLMIGGENDTVVPYKAEVKTARRIKNSRFVSLPVGHFEVYAGEMFEKVVQIEAEFLKEALLGG